jgi:hypothetical protein
LGFTGHPLALSAPGRSLSETDPVITYLGPLSPRLSALPLIPNRRSLQDLRCSNLPHPAVRSAYPIQYYPVAPLSHGSPAGSHVAGWSRSLISWCRRIGEFVALHEFFFFFASHPLIAIYRGRPDTPSGWGQSFPRHSHTYPLRACWTAARAVHTHYVGAEPLLVQFTHTTPERVGRPSSARHARVSHGPQPSKLV